MLVSGTFTAVDQVSAPIATLDGATVVLSRTFDGWVSVEVSCDGAGTRYVSAGTLVGPGPQLVSCFGSTSIRLKCVKYTSGTINYDIVSAD